MTAETFNISFIKYNPQLGEKLGRGASLFLSALQFLLKSEHCGIEREGRKWIYNTAEQWAEYLGYSTRQIERIISKLTQQGIIAVRKLNRFKANRTNYYTVNEEKLALLLQEKEGIEGSTSSASTKSIPVKSVKPFDKMSECFRPEDGFISKKLNKEYRDTKSGKPTTPCIQPIQQVENIKLEEKKNNTSSNTVDHSRVKTTTVQDMVEIWNKIHENANTQISKSLAPLCIAAFKQKFDSDLKQWEHYCKTLATSSYLTGKDFQLSLYWALKYSTIERIQKGEFGVKELSFSSYSQQDALDHITQVNEPERCKEVRIKLLKLYGEKVYKDWFERITFMLIEDKVSFKTENKFMHDYIRDTFSAIMG